MSTVRSAHNFEPAALASVAYAAILQSSLEDVGETFVVRLGGMETTASAALLPHAK
jgi:hypothetical protein